MPLASLQGKLTVFTVQLGQKAACLALPSKALRHHNTMQDWLSTDYYPDVLRGLLLIRCPSFTLHLLSHLCVTNMSCLMPGSLPVPWCVVFCWVFFGLGWVGCLFSVRLSVFILPGL